MLLNPFIGSVGVGVGGATYFFDERFEGTGYQNSWTEAGTGTINEDYTTSPLEGSQSLLLSATAQAPRTTAVLPSDLIEAWFFFKMRIDTSISATRQIFGLQNTTPATVGGMSVDTTNHLLAANGTSTTAATTDALTTGTDYNIWFHWIKGTGANGFSSVGFSTGTTEVTAGNAFKSLSNGNGATDLHQVLFRITNDAGTATTGAFVFDMLLISDTATIGDNPS